MTSASTMSATTSLGAGLDAAAVEEGEDSASSSHRASDSKSEVLHPSSVIPLALIAPTSTSRSPDTSSTFAPTPAPPPFISIPMEFSTPVPCLQQLEMYSATDTSSPSRTGQSTSSRIRSWSHNFIERCKDGWSPLNIALFVLGSLGIYWAIKSYGVTKYANTLAMMEACRQHPKNPALQDSPLCQQMKTAHDFDHDYIEHGWNIRIPGCKSSRSWCALFRSEEEPTTCFYIIGCFSIWWSRKIIVDFIQYLWMICVFGISYLAFRCLVL